MKKIMPFAVALIVLIYSLPVYSAVKKNIRLTSLTGMERIKQDQKPHGARKVDVKAAKNERESFQVVVAALRENIRVENAEISDLVTKNGSRIGKENFTLFKEEYIRIRNSAPRAVCPPGLYPDPLIPFINPITGKPIEQERRIWGRWGEPSKLVGHPTYPLPFEVWKGQNQPIWIDVHVPKSANAGIYKGKFIITTSEEITAEIPVILTVWDFTIPDGPIHKNRIWGFRNAAKYFSLDPNSEKFKEIEMQYCAAMAEHHMTPPIPDRLFPEVNDDGSLNITPAGHRALKEFMDKFNVEDIMIPRAPFLRLPHSTLNSNYKYISPENKEKAFRYYRGYYKYLKDNGWEKRAYFYIHDEPNTPENYEQIIEYGKVVREAVPEMRISVSEQTYPHEPTWPDIDPYIDIWCPLLGFIDKKTIDEKISQGDEVWSYSALCQRAPSYHPAYDYVKDFDPPYWQIDFPLADYRVPMWINWQYNITGYLYWSTTSTVIDPWWNPAFRNRFNGDGYLFYPGKPCGIDGPVSSMRMKNLRDGMEDYDYFSILKDLGGKEAIDEIVNTIAPNWWDFSRDPEKYVFAREKLAEAILNAKR